jgi:hypothetical protein
MKSNQIISVPWQNEDWAIVIFNAFNYDEGAFDYFDMIIHQKCINPALSIIRRIVRARAWDIDNEIALVYLTYNTTDFPY